MKSLPETRLENPRIEIQIASLLMHAWSEVEHDLTYKKKKGSVSYDEYEALDELNGIVLTGEISLQRLQRISESRIAFEKKGFESHYQLASYLYERASKLSGNSSIYLGDVETLFYLFRKKDRLTTRKVDNDLQKVDWSDSTPVAQQLIDSYVDSNVNDAKLVISNKYRKTTLQDEYGFDDAQIGTFLRKWILFETKIQEIMKNRGQNEKKPGGIHRLIVEGNIIPSYLYNEYNMLRQARNRIVHGAEFPRTSDLERYCDLINKLLDYLTMEYGV